MEARPEQTVHTWAVPPCSWWLNHKKYLGDSGHQLMQAEGACELLCPGHRLWKPPSTPRLGVARISMSARSGDSPTRVHPNSSPPW